MRLLARLFEHPLTGPTIRYGIAGITVASVYLGTPIVLNSAWGLSIQAGIPIAYVVAISLHFTLQRLFVFRHVETFALSRRQQVMRYAVIAAFQYPTTALATAVLPGLLHISSKASYLATATAIAIATYVVLRTRVFHPLEPLLPAHEELADLDVAEVELVRRGAGPAGQLDVDAVEAPMEGNRDAERARARDRDGQRRVSR